VCLPAVKSCQPEAASRVGQTSRRLLTPAFSMPSACVLPRWCSSRWPRATEHGPWCSSDGVVGGAGVVANCLEEAFERLQILERSERSQCSILSILRAREIFSARCVPWASRFSVGAHGLVAGARGALVLVAGAWRVHVRRAVTRTRRDPTHKQSKLSHSFSLRLPGLRNVCVRYTFCVF
jgi:hypothetical protein